MWLGVIDPEYNERVQDWSKVQAEQNIVLRVKLRVNKHKNPYHEQLDRPWMERTEYQCLYCGALL